MADIDRIERELREAAKPVKDLAGVGPRGAVYRKIKPARADLMLRAAAELSRRSEVIERAKEALTEALVAMKLASALPGVSDEYDFEPAIATVSAARALLQGESNG